MPSKPTRMLHPQVRGDVVVEAKSPAKGAKVPFAAEVVKGVDLKKAKVGPNLLSPCTAWMKSQALACAPCVLACGYEALNYVSPLHCA